MGYSDMVNALRWLITEQIQKKYRFTRGLLGDGQGNVDVDGRAGFSLVRPDRGSNKTWHIFNKQVDAPDGTPILIGEMPWQPGLQQVLGIDWETYMTVGWDSRFAGLAKHGVEHEWRDTVPGSDTFHVYRRQLYPLRTETANDGTKVVVNPYGLSVTGTFKYWPGSPVLDLADTIPPVTGTERFSLVYWDFSGDDFYGELGVATGTLEPISDVDYPTRPTEPVGTIPSAYVRLQFGQTTITDQSIYDARPLWVPYGSSIAAATTGNWKLGNVLVVSSSGDGDYLTIAAAIAAASAGDTIIVDQGTYICENQTLPAGATLLGQGIDSTTLMATGSTRCIIGGGAGLVQDISLEIDRTSVGGIGSMCTAFEPKAADRGINVKGKVTNIGAYSTFAQGISVNFDQIRLANCFGESTGHGLVIGGSITDVVVDGGEFEGVTGVSVMYDINLYSQAQAELRGPKATWGNVHFSTATGTRGWITGGGGEPIFLGGVIINETGLRTNTRIEGDGEPNLVVVDAENNRLGLKTASPNQSIHLVENHSDTAGRGIKLENQYIPDGIAPMMIEFDRTATDANLSVKLGVDHTGRDFFIEVAGSDRLNIDENGVVTIGATGEVSLIVTDLGSYSGIRAANAFVGRSALAAQYAVFGHFNLITNSGAYSIRQTSGGTTVVNSYDADLYFRRQNLTVMRLNNDEVKLYEKVTVSTSIAARMYRNTTQSINSGAITTIDFTTVRRDDSGATLANVTDDRFDITVAGWYVISLHVRFDSNATGIRGIYIYDNATIIAHFTQPATSGSDTMTISTVYYFASSGPVYFKVYQDSGGALNITYNANYSPEAAICRLI
jgi:hypothetical protein